MSGMLLVTPGMHPERGIAKASRHPRLLHVFQKSMDFKGTNTKGYTYSARCRYTHPCRACPCPCGAANDDDVHTDSSSIARAPWPCGHCAVDARIHL